MYNVCICYMYGPMSDLTRLCRNASVIFQPYLSFLDSNICGVEGRFDFFRISFKF